MNKLTTSLVEMIEESIENGTRIYYSKENFDGSSDIVKILPIDYMVWDNAIQIDTVSGTYVIMLNNLSYDDANETYRIECDYYITELSCVRE